MERLDDLQFRGLKMIQDTELFCFGCDAVELANFAGGKPGLRVCDLGAGNGIISVLLAGKFGQNVTAVEIQAESATLIERNAALNGLSDKIACVHLPMQAFAQAYRGNGFDRVVCNPPYRKLLGGERQQKTAVARARHETDVTLREVIDCTVRLLRFGGDFFVVQASERLAETLFLCKSRRLEPKILQVLRPCDDKKPHLFLLKCTLGGGEGLSVLPERNVKTYGVE